MKSKYFILISLFFVFSCINKVEKENNTIHQITILHTNDHHGHFWKNRYGEYGMAARKTLIDSIKKEVKEKGGIVFLFSGGDINTGTPESDMQNAEPDFKAMNLLGYDAMALGNHEFDNSIDILMKQKKWVNFPMLSANIYDKRTNKTFFPAYHIFKRKNIKIAVIGLTTEDTQKIANPDSIKNLIFKDPKKEAKKLIEYLKKEENPDITIALTHMGHYQNANHTINAPGDVSLARYLPKNYLNLIVGGHTQFPVCMDENNNYDKNFSAGKECKPDFQNNTWIVQAYEWGKYLGRMDFIYKDNKLKLVKYKLIPINLKKKVNGKRVFASKEIKEDKEIYEFLKYYKNKGDKKLNVKIAKINEKLEGNRDIIRNNQTNLGQLILKSSLEKIKADIAIFNSGGIRDSIEKGEITYRDILKVLPFANKLSYVDIKGKELKKYLIKVSNFPKDTGAYPQILGFKVIKDNNKFSVTINGQTLDNDKIYRLSLPSYIASGGDGYPKLNTHKGYVDSGFIDADIFKEYLEKNYPLN